jgi:hypothetical protein
LRRFPKTLREKAAVNSLFIPASAISESRGTLRLLPAQERIADLSKDLASMREMFFDSPPELEQLLQILDGWVSTFNHA